MLISFLQLKNKKYIYVALLFLKFDLELFFETLYSRNTATEGLVQHTLQAIWVLGLMERWFCIWDDLANPKIGLNLVPNCL
ncbi:hypothetical protein CLU83_0933 [Flavobacterium sp. 1]|nr:hypothetical protein CLU83_0933 [Flavobacterium sp. 1]